MDTEVLQFFWGTSIEMIKNHVQETREASGEVRVLLRNDLTASQKRIWASFLSTYRLILEQTESLSKILTHESTKDLMKWGYAEGASAVFGPDILRKWNRLTDSAANAASLAPDLFDSIKTRENHNQQTITKAFRSLENLRPGLSQKLGLKNPEIYLEEQKQSTLVIFDTLHRVWIGEEPSSLWRLTSLSEADLRVLLDMSTNIVEIRQILLLLESHAKFGPEFQKILSERGKPDRILPLASSYFTEEIEPQLTKFYQNFDRLHKFLDSTLFSSRSSNKPEIRALYHNVQALKDKVNMTARLIGSTPALMAFIFFAKDFQFVDYVQGFTRDVYQITPDLLLHELMMGSFVPIHDFSNKSADNHRTINRQEIYWSLYYVFLMDIPLHYGFTKEQFFGRLVKDSAQSAITVLRKSITQLDSVFKAEVELRDGRLVHKWSHPIFNICADGKLHIDRLPKEKRPWYSVSITPASTGGANNSDPLTFYGSADGRPTESNIMKDLLRLIGDWRWAVGDKFMLFDSLYFIDTEVDLRLKTFILTDHMMQMSGAESALTSSSEGGRFIQDLRELRRSYLDRISKLNSIFSDCILDLHSLEHARRRDLVIMEAQYLQRIFQALSELKDLRVTPSMSWKGLISTYPQSLFATDPFYNVQTTELESENYLVALNLIFAERSGLDTYFQSAPEYRSSYLTQANIQFDNNRHVFQYRHLESIFRMTTFIERGFDGRVVSGPQNFISYDRPKSINEMRLTLDGNGAGKFVAASPYSIAVDQLVLNQDDFVSKALSHYLLRFGSGLRQRSSNNWTPLYDIGRFMTHLAKYELMEQPFQNVTESCYPACITDASREKYRNSLSEVTRYITRVAQSFHLDSQAKEVLRAINLVGVGSFLASFPTPPNSYDGRAPRPFFEYHRILPGPMDLGPTRMGLLDPIMHYLATKELDNRKKGTWDIRNGLGWESESYVESPSSTDSDNPQSAIAGLFGGSNVISAEQLKTKEHKYELALRPSTRFDEFIRRESSLLPFPIPEVTRKAIRALNTHLFHRDFEAVVEFERFATGWESTQPKVRTHFDLKEDPWDPMPVYTPDFISAYYNRVNSFNKLTEGTFVPESLRQDKRLFSK